MSKSFLFALALVSVGCTTLSLAPATEPAEAANRPANVTVAPLGAEIDTSWLKNGRIRVLSNMCEDIYGHYGIHYGGCSALVMLGDCDSAPGGTCECTVMPLQQSEGCENIGNGSGVFQWID